MSKMKDLRKQMKKQLKEFEEQIETLGEQADAVEAAAVKRSQERVVNLVDTMDAQLKVWQNAMPLVNAKMNGAVTTTGAADPTPEITAIWASMQTQIKQWLTTTATLRMEVGADALWQLETLRTLDMTANEKLRTLKKAQNGERVALQETAEQALDDLKHALERALPE